MLCVEEENSSPSSKTQHEPASNEMMVKWAKCPICAKTWVCDSQKSELVSEVITYLHNKGPTKITHCNDCLNSIEVFKQLSKIKTKNYSVTPNKSNHSPMITDNQQQNKKIHNILANILDSCQMQQVVSNQVEKNYNFVKSILNNQYKIKSKQKLTEYTKNNNRTLPQSTEISNGYSPEFQLSRTRSHNGSQNSINSINEDNEQFVETNKNSSLLDNFQKLIDLNNTRVTLNNLTKYNLLLNKKKSVLPFSFPTSLSNTNELATIMDAYNYNNKTEQDLHKTFNPSSFLQQTENENFFKKQKFSSPSMQSLADIGRTPGTIWKHAPVISTNKPSSSSIFLSCSVCNKTFKTESMLKLHQRSHMNNEDNGYLEYSYNKCGTSTATSKISCQNKEEENNGKCKPAICPICGRKSPSLGYLKIHMRSHKKTLDHICHICGRGFKEHWYLTTHLRTHDKSLISSSHHSKFEENNTCSRGKDEVKSVQHNEVQQQLRLMIERNQRQQSTGEETSGKGAVNVDKNIKSKIHRDFQKIIASAAKQNFLIENVFKKNELTTKNDQQKNEICYQGNLSNNSFENGKILNHVQLASCDRGFLKKAAVIASNKESMQRRKSKPQKFYFEQANTHDELKNYFKQISREKETARPFKSEIQAVGQPLDLRVVKKDS